MLASAPAHFESLPDFELPPYPPRPLQICANPLRIGPPTPNARPHISNTCHPALLTLAALAAHFDCAHFESPPAPRRPARSLLTRVFPKVFQPARPALQTRALRTPPHFQCTPATSNAHLPTSNTRTPLNRAHTPSHALPPLHTHHPQPHLHFECPPPHHPNARPLHLPALACPPRTPNLPTSHAPHFASYPTPHPPAPTPPAEAAPTLSTRILALHLRRPLSPALRTPTLECPHNGSPDSPAHHFAPPSPARPSSYLPSTQVKPLRTDARCTPRRTPRVPIAAARTQIPRAPAPSAWTPVAPLAQTLIAYAYVHSSSTHALRTPRVPTLVPQANLSRTQACRPHVEVAG
ncbi:hypothetical protein K438DRAFT_1988753 [Mycena galopus ATCC 62051]|nr:hypothetical protein K438DRAFT_1988753 [Mycena galopus ATCC 62051]